MQVVRLLGLATWHVKKVDTCCPFVRTCYLTYDIATWHVLKVKR